MQKQIIKIVLLLLVLVSGLTMLPKMNKVLAGTCGSCTLWCVDASVCPQYDAYGNPTGNGWCSTNTCCDGNAGSCVIDCTPGFYACNRAGGCCPIGTATPPPPPVATSPPTSAPITCTISLAPTTNLTVGGANGTVTASVSCNVAFDGVLFASLNTGIATVSPTTLDNTSPYTTSVHPVAVGSTSVRGTVYVGGVARGNATATVNVAAQPCAVTTSPASLNLALGGSAGTVTASVTSGLGSATVTSMAFGSYNTSRVTVSPTSDSSNPYSTSVTAVSLGTASVWATANLSDGRQCPAAGTADTDITVTAPTCTISLSPSSTNLTMGGTTTGTITANVSCTAPVNGVTFSSSSGTVTVSPASPTQDTSSPYTATVTGVSVGSSTITGTVFSGGAARASATATVNVIAPTCTISLAPATTNLTVGGTITGTLTATVSCSAPVTNVTFASSNSGIVSVAPASDTTAPYTATVTGLTTGSATITATVFSGGSARGSATATVNVSALACAVTTSPAVLNLNSGQTGTVTASVTSGLGSATVTRMNFGSYNTGIVTVNPASDLTSIYSTTVSTVSVGSAAVWATATLSDNRTCAASGAADTDVVVAPTCTITLTPPATNLIQGNPDGIVTATVSCTAAVNNVTFTSSNPGSVTIVSTNPDITSPYTASVHAVGSGSSTITGTVFSGGVARGSATAVVNVNAPTCTISLTPATTNLTLGGIDGSIIATVNCTAPIDNVTFTSSNPAFVAVTSVPADTTTPYTATIHAVSTGAAIITGTVFIGGVPIQSGTAVVNSAPLSAWFQVRDADVYSGNDLTTNITSPVVFDLTGNGTYPGIPSRAGSTDLTNAKASTPYGWLVQNTSVNQKVYDYQTLVSQIPADTIINTLGSTVTASDFNASNSSYGYTWYRYVSSGGLPLTINGNVDLTNKKVILLVDGNLSINGRINVSENLNGFFMTLVKGNITVGTAVGGAPPQATPNLEGIYEADGTFSDGVSANQLWVRGSVAAYGGTSLDRDLVGGNATYPAELFEFAPDQLLLYPGKLGTRKLNWKEVAP